MPRNARIATLLAAVVIVVAAFVVLRPGDEGSTTTTTDASTQATTPQATTTEAAKPRPEVATIRISGGEPVGGVRKLTFKEGGTIRFRVTDEADDEVHLHGYDVEKPVGPGKAASFSVPATITGRFEVELHNNATPIAEVTFEP
ncbi:MAG: hypothetical protein ACKOTH_01460 [Solirubrobacterales bacterium]